MNKKCRKLISAFLIVALIFSLGVSASATQDSIVDDRGTVRLGDVFELTDEYLERLREKAKDELARAYAEAGELEEEAAEEFFSAQINAFSAEEETAGQWIGRGEKITLNLSDAEILSEKDFFGATAETHSLDAENQSSVLSESQLNTESSDVVRGETFAIEDKLSTEIALAAALADIEISGLSFEQTPIPYSGTRMGMYIRNLGGISATNPIVNIYRNENSGRVLLGEITINGTLEPGGIYGFDFGIRKQPTGTFTFTVNVNEDRTIVESNYNNNIAFVSASAIGAWDLQVVDVTTNKLSYMTNYDVVLGGFVIANMGSDPAPATIARTLEGTSINYNIGNQISVPSLDPLYGIMVAFNRSFAISGLRYYGAWANANNVAGEYDTSNNRTSKVINIQDPHYVTLPENTHIEQEPGYYTTGDPHNGYDILGERDDAIYAMASGIVYAAGTNANASTGYCIILNHSGDNSITDSNVLVSRYLHLDDIPNYMTNQQVPTPGSRLGNMGDTGFALNNNPVVHLHWDANTRGVFYSPESGVNHYCLNLYELFPNIAFTGLATARSTNGNSGLANETSFEKHEEDFSASVRLGHFIDSRIIFYIGVEAFEAWNRTDTLQDLRGLCKDFGLTQNDIYDILEGDHIYKMIDKNLIFS